MNNIHKEWIAMPVDDFVERVTPAITLRDFFAGCALAGCIIHGASPEIIADAAYNFADAMLKARGEE